MDVAIRKKKKPLERVISRAFVTVCDIRALFFDIDNNKKKQDHNMLIIITFFFK